MKYPDLSCLALILAMPFNSAIAEAFPKAPATLKEMEVKGLPRLSSAEMKAFFPGVVISKGVKGKHIITHKPDGSMERKGFKDKPGKWRIDDKNNTYCKGFQKRIGYDENCFAVFKSPDGIHYFDYDIDDGFYAHVWRKYAQ